ncbi:reverse transcriptase domain, Reverse transcriptase zinc-binding domain protein [Artemisia annua]|uniref:Reverse transcriptase domain, Reverse transcriptase zinc-binding domain protein n=1 Tax=Artemisia annua TaxID=35608 RepID=A0A2U1PJL6_ARTAN|nr:reverse transcriptase domain, Reverse transcriptase zinc-binding domain protein [Artemisia annua]
MRNLKQKRMKVKVKRVNMMTNKNQMRKKDIRVQKVKVNGNRMTTATPESPITRFSILREVHVLDVKGFKFLSHCRIRVGDGSKTKFWLDPWISDMALCDRFPRVFALESAKEVLVVDKMGVPSFCTSFRRQIRDGAENQQWTDLISTLDPIRLSPSSDRWVCDLNGEGYDMEEFVNYLL